MFHLTQQEEDYLYNSKKLFLWSVLECCLIKGIYSIVFQGTVWYCCSKRQPVTLCGPLR